MIAEFEKSTPQGEILAPPSKSIAHRYLISAFMSGGACKIDNISLSEDIKATINCLKALGADIDIHNKSVTVKRGHETDVVLDCNESGSTLRFLIPVAMNTGRKITFTGKKKLFERPLGIYEDIAREQGLLFDKEDNSLTVSGKLKSGKYTLNGNISSQFISGLLFVLPTLAGDSEIEIIPPFESRSYVLITIDVLKQFGISIDLRDNTIKITGNQQYISTDAFVEGDYSNAAYVDALNFLGGSVKLEGLNNKSLQGDNVYVEYFKKLKSYCTLDISDCPDLGPILFSVAALNEGAHFTGTKRLAIKESDRAAAMREELLKLGIDAKVSENEVIIPKTAVTKPKEILSSHNDHRILMAASLLLCKTGGRISGAEAVNKSFPDYFDILKQLGCKVTIHE